MENLIDDIAPNIDCTRALLGEAVVMAQKKPGRTTQEFVVDVQEAMTLESLDAIPMPFDFDGVDHINTQDLSLTQVTLSCTTPQ